MIQIRKSAWWTIILFAPLALAGCRGDTTSRLDDVSLASERTSASFNSNTSTPDENTYYVRPDGGTPEECSGFVDAAYPGSGSKQACAWDHPFRALPPGGTPRIGGGSTLVIGTGSYRMGYGAPGSDDCEEEGSFDCRMPPVPSGPSPNRPTRIVGRGWDSGCDNPPELWGTGRPWQIVDLTDTSNAVVACLEITDHSDCVEFHSGGLACNRDDLPYGDWASIGLYAQDSTKVLLKDLNIHGLASSGILAGRLTDWTVENVRIAANGWVGWDGDIEGDDSNAGTLAFRHWLVEWNGCGETYPEQEPVGCWGQSAGGYGDGVGTGATSGDWIIENASFLHNTSDGLDLLYHSEGGTVILNGVHAEGNAGNPVKVTGLTTLSNSLLVSNCTFFDDQPFTFNVDPCRALGNALEITFTGGEQVSIINSTFYGLGDGLIYAGPREGYNCDGSERIEARNNIFLGDADFFDPGDSTFLFYQEDCDGLRLDSDYNLVHQVKDFTCGSEDAYVISGNHDKCQDPRLNGPFFGLAFRMSPASGSPAIDAADDAICTATDLLGLDRPVDGDGDGDAQCDMGAYEFDANRGAR